MSTPRGEKGAFKVSVPKLEKVVKDFKAINKDAENVVKRTVSDFKSRAPGWVSAAVTKTYGVPPAEIRSSFTGVGKSVGRVRAEGTEIESASLVYSGRVLTPTHFKMKPSTPELKRGTPYQKPISATFFKGKRQQITRRAFLAPTGATSADKTSHIPFQRMGAKEIMEKGKHKGKKRQPIYKVLTLSLPQMIDNKDVRTQIQENIDKKLGERIEGHIDRAFKNRG